MNPAEQHIKITLKQSSTNQLIQRDKSSLIWFEKLQGRLPCIWFPFLQVSPVKCTQSPYLITHLVMYFFLREWELSLIEFKIGILTLLEYFLQVVHLFQEQPTMIVSSR
jgi:hypothetical protein